MARQFVCYGKQLQELEGRWFLSFFFVFFCVSLSFFQCFWGLVREFLVLYQGLCLRGGRLWRSNLYSRVGVKWIICFGDFVVFCFQVSYFRFGGLVTWVCRARFGVRRRCERKGIESKFRFFYFQGLTRCRYR